MTSSQEWTDFTDGFQYFKLNLRFLNPIFNLRSKLDGHKEGIPSRMYGLLLEDRSAVIWFINLILVLSVIIICKITYMLLFKLIFNKRSSQNSRLKYGMFSNSFNVLSKILKFKLKINVLNNTLLILN